MSTVPQTNPPISEEDKLRIRQQERTVDNLNRLFAMLFSIVFSLAIASVLQQIAEYIKLPYKEPDWEIVSFYTLALVILGTTAAIFFHQASRGLDLQYGASHNITPHRAAFLFDYLVIFLTMFPFALMAKALEWNIVKATGFFWFFVSHEILIFFGLIMLILKQIRLIIFGDSNINPEFAKIGLGVERYWFVMNSFYILIAAGSFMIASGSYAGSLTCPLYPNRPGTLSFMFVFFIIAMLRNGFDYFWMWNVFFPIKPAGANGKQVFWPPLQNLVDYVPTRLFGLKLSLPVIFGYICLFSASYIIFHITKLHALVIWANICS